MAIWTQDSIDLQILERSRRSPKKLDATQISARSSSYMINKLRSLTLVKNSLRTIAISDGVQRALW